MYPAIETHELTRHFGKVIAVDRLSLRVQPGEIYAFLGLNGAGKSTTIRMLLGMIRPTAGEAWLLGKRVGPGQRQPWPAVGYLVESAEAYPELTVRENLEALRRLRPGTPPAAVNAVIERLALTSYADRKAGVLSHGNRQRLGLAKALLHEPELIILDEPANGLDPAGIVEVRNLLLDLAHRRGVTVFMSSHILGEVAKLADRIGIIHQGRLLRELGVAELERDRRRRLLVKARDNQAACAALEAAGFAATLTADDSIALSEARAIEGPESVSALLVTAGHPPTMLLNEQEELEAYFLRLIGAQGGQEAADE